MSWHLQKLYRISNNHVFGGFDNIDGTRLRDATDQNPQIKVRVYVVTLTLHEASARIFDGTGSG